MMRLTFALAAALAATACADADNPDAAEEEAIEETVEAEPIPQGEWTIDRVNGQPIASVYPMTISSDGATLRMASQCVAREWAIVREGGDTSFEQRPIVSCDRGLTDGEESVIEIIDDGSSMMVLSGTNKLMLSGLHGTLSGEGG